jgi:hypothetical protein
MIKYYNWGCAHCHAWLFYTSVAPIVKRCPHCGKRNPAMWAVAGRGVPEDIIGGAESGDIIIAVQENHGGLA